MVVAAGASESRRRDVAVEIDERRHDPAADERRERPLARDRRAGAGHEEPDRTSIGVRRGRERGHDDDGDRPVGAAARGRAP